MAPLHILHMVSQLFGLALHMQLVRLAAGLQPVGQLVLPSGMR